MGGSMDYASSGVDRAAREKAKSALSSLEGTYSLSQYGKVVRTPFNVLYPLGNGLLQVKTSDGVGTKVMLAQLAEKHDSIGIDAVAMVVNDCIRCGAAPLALTDTIDVQKSTPELLGALQKGLAAGAMEADCPIVGGETADVPELMAAPYHINADCVGNVEKSEVIDAGKIREGDRIIGLPSSGIHSNGMSLARRALFRKWGGKYEGSEPVSTTGRSILLEALQPTKIYVKPFLKLMRDVDVRGAVHVTGDAYLKFLRLGSHGFSFANFKPPEIFSLIQAAGNISDEEMFRTFNMGWGFAVIVSREDADDALQRLPGGAESIGEITREGVTVEFKGRKFPLA